MALAIVFSGQGMQHADMLPWLRDDALPGEMASRLGRDDWRAALRDPDWAACNLNAQLVLTATALAAWRQIAGSLPRPVAIAGYSVGELAAFSAAGIFDADVALDIATRRALAMDRCAARAPGGLMAVSGASTQALAAVCSNHGLDVAIRNGCFSAVLGGPLAALDRAEDDLASRGARCTRLRVGVRSHTPAMRDAADDLLRELAAIPFRRPALPLFCNARGDRIADAASARPLLAAQVATTVRWADCMEGLRARQPRCVLEIGPAQALARMWNERYPDIPARSCDEFRSAPAIAAWVQEAAAR